MIDFPASPTVGQIFTSGGQQWMWDGAKWLPNGSIATTVLAMNDNRIINGDMRIDQRNNGASGTAAGYTIDRWQYLASQASKITWGRTASPGAFPYCWGCQSSSAYASVAADYFALAQYIEADMVSDFQWGSATAQPVTLSFLVYSSLTGTFGGCIRGGGSYPFTYSLPTASTWTKIVITIPGATSGSWVMSGNAAGVQLLFDLGSGSTNLGPPNAWSSTAYVGATGCVSIVGTNAAIWRVTGVKLEIGSTATPFSRQSLAKSMADCQRYYCAAGGYSVYFSGNVASGGVYSAVGWFPVTMRAAPTVSLSPVSAGSFPNASSSASATTPQTFAESRTANATANGAWFISTFTASAEL